MKTYDIWKMIDEDYERMKGKKYRLAKTPKRIEGLQVGDIAIVGKTANGAASLFSKGWRFDLTGFEEWEEVKEPVDFMEAVKSGKKIRSATWMQNTELDLPNLLYDMSDFDEEEIRQLLLGKWHIED